MRRHEATPLPGQGGANAQILRRLIALQANLTRAEIETFAKILLPPLLDAKQGAMDTIAKLADGDTLEKRRAADFARTFDVMLSKVVDEAGGKLPDALLKIATQYATGTEAAILKSLPGVPGSIFTAFDMDAVENAATSYSKQLTGWLSGPWKDASLDAAKNAVLKGIATGDDVESIARDVGRVTGTATEKARMATRSAVHANAVDVRDQYLQDNSDVFDSKLWVATLDHRTCSLCGPLDGKTWAIDDPSAPKNPQHPNERCQWCPVVASWEDIGLDPKLLPPATRASMNGEVPATLDYDQWLKQQQEAEGKGWIRRYLGNRRYEQWIGGESVAMDFRTEMTRWRLEADARAIATHREKMRRFLTTF